MIQQNISKMFYVVFLERFAKYVVIPKEWLRNDKSMMEKFMKKGINVMQSHICYINEATSKTLGVNAAQDLTPNFHARMSDEYPCIEGTFYCTVAAFYGKPVSLFVFIRRDSIPF